MNEPYKPLSHDTTRHEVYVHFLIENNNDNDLFIINLPRPTDPVHDFNSSSRPFRRQKVHEKECDINTRLGPAVDPFPRQEASKAQLGPWSTIVQSLPFVAALS